MEEKPILEKAERIRDVIRYIKRFKNAAMFHDKTSMSTLSVFSSSCKSFNAARPFPCRLKFLAIKNCLRYRG
ncbi:MAG: hypothetical protein K6G00_09940, partial [Treponema sp.]|nr:hypothetical protein [Treponema sp.]